MQKLWVDYTNLRGERAWREISGFPREPYWSRYDTWVLDVFFPDRGNERRALRLDHIHGFHVGETKPKDACNTCGSTSWPDNGCPDCCGIKGDIG